MCSSIIPTHWQQLERPLIGGTFWRAFLDASVIMMCIILSFLRPIKCSNDRSIMNQMCTVTSHLTSLSLRSRRDGEELVEHVLLVVLCLDLRESIVVFPEDVSRPLVVLLMRHVSKYSPPEFDPLASILTS